MIYNGVIYCAISPSGKKYYGFTYNLKRRKYDHKRNSLIKKNIFYGAIKKYGFENFIWNIIETYQNENKEIIQNVLRKREKYWINKDKTYLRKYGYNMTRGGDGGDTFSGKSEEDKLKINKKRSQLFKGENNPMYGKKVYDIWIKKYGKEKADIKLAIMKKKSSEAKKGKPHLCSEETKIKISKALMGENHPKYIKLPNEQINDIINLYSKEKKSITQIQKKYNLNYYKIKKILLDNGIEFKNKRLYKNKINE